MGRLGKVIRGLLALLLTVAVWQAVAEPQSAGRAFNHMTTGFSLSGGHAAAACETCHNGGVFKGTPRNCDGCHATGKRIVATPKSNNHIYTDAPCESCHFNTASWLGARFNHGTAKTGQCATCHNGRISTDKHRTHIPTTYSCDKCHRSSAWIPASWNHTGVVGTCASAGCHVQGSNQYYRGTTHTGYKLSDPVCEDCHNYYAWSPARYKHNSTALCSSCHNGTIAVGKSASHGYTSAECNTCHTNTITWQGASYHNGAVAGICGTCHNGTNGVKGTVNDPNGMHIPLPAGGNPNCGLCHTSTTTFSVYVMNHSGSTTCNTCHASTSPYVVTTKRQLGNHQGSSVADSCSTCHTSTSTWLGALGAMPSNHIPFNAGVSCSSCHSGAAKVNINTLHIYSSSNTCAVCHISPNAYTGNSQQTKKSHKGSSGSNCAQSGCHFNAAAYKNWDE